MSNVCSYIFEKKQVFFRGYPQYGRGVMTDKCTPQLYDKSPPAAIKKAVRKRFSADAFARRALL